jgi:phosphatidylglycerophosphatase C
VQLAVFDLDGTISRRDTLVPYITGFLGPASLRWLGLLGVIPSVPLYALKVIDRGGLKGSLIHWTLGGATRSQIQNWNQRFVPALLRDGLFRDAVARIDEHRRSGDKLVLMSASTDLYVPDIGRALGFDEVICTGVRWNGDRLDGRVNTPNRRGEEKARCFRELQRKYAGLASAAYGNAGSDLPHLRLADHGYLINGSASARAEAQKLGVESVSWI